MLPRPDSTCLLQTSFHVAARMALGLGEPDHVIPPLKPPKASWLNQDRIDTSHQCPWGPSWSVPWSVHLISSPFIHHFAATQTFLPPQEHAQLVPASWSCSVLSVSLNSLKIDIPAPHSAILHIMPESLWRQSSENRLIIVAHTQSGSNTYKKGEFSETLAHSKTTMRRWRLQLGQHFSKSSNANSCPATSRC
jgi:hypothetical protein